MNEYYGKRRIRNGELKIEHTRRETDIVQIEMEGKESLSGPMFLFNLYATITMG